MAVYFFYGEEEFNIETEIEKMRSKLNPDFISMSFHTLDNPEFPELMNVLRTPPMMFGDSLCIIDAYEYFYSKKTYFEDKDFEEIEAALKNNPEGLNIVFVVRLPRGENKKIDSRRKLYKILSKFNTKEFPVFKTYETDKISAWVKNRAKTKDLYLQSDALELLVEQIGNNLRDFDVELDKLKLATYPETTVTKKMVEEISISNQDLFNITDLIMKNRKDLALLEYKKLTDKKHPMEILSAIQTMLRKCIILKAKSGKLSVFELAKLTGFTEYGVKQNLAKLKHTSAADLVKLKQNLYAAECKIKSAESIDVNAEVEIALIR